MLQAPAYLSVLLVNRYASFASRQYLLKILAVAIMDLFNRHNLERLAELEDDVCISLYMPTHRYESDWSQNPTRLKNLLREARSQLQEQGHRGNQIDEILAEARQQLDRPDFWRGMSEGLAVFITPENTEFFRLPLSFDEVAVVNDRFHLKPLFPLIATNNRFYLLALSKNDVRLYQGTHQAISEVRSAEIPRDILEAVQKYDDTEEDGRLEARTQNQSAQGAERSRSDAAHRPRHGHGVTSEDLSDEPQVELKRFFREVDESVSDYLGEENVPLVLAGVKEYLPIYKEVNSFQHLIEDEIVSGNPEPLNMKELHQKAWQIVEPVFLEAQDKEKDRFEQLYYQDGGLASGDFHEIIPACAYGRVDTLFVPVEEHRWGRFDPDSNTVEIHESQQPGDGDLLNYAAVKAYLNGGSVHALRSSNMPEGRSVAATFRYKTGVTATENG